ncbi:mannosyl-oligosaccharide alpha-1,2-mannosidase [Allomyces arbusculus]|nr:mannosyl-oligosaccharide alpha-1,2-mannosidase [Allomyces arbusculus]
MHSIPTPRRAVVEARQQAARQREFARSDLVKHLTEDKVLRDAFTNDERVERNRRVREYRAHATEAQLVHQHMANQAEQEQRQKAREEEEALLHAIQQQHDELVRQEKIRQSIRENSVELRELEHKLHAAYMNAERATQVQHKKLAHEQAVQQDRAYAAQVQTQLERAASAEQAQEEAAWKRSRQYKAYLQHQLDARAQAKEADMAQFLKEKELVDAMVRRIQEEDAAELQQRYAQQRQTRAFIDEYLFEREAWLAAERAKMEEENAKIAEHVRQQERRAEAQRAERAAAEQARAQVYETLTADMTRTEKARAELEELRTELAVAEQHEREALRERQDMERRLAQKLELIAAYQQQIAERRRAREAEREEEDAFRARMLAKLAEDARLDQLSREKKRLKQLEHKRAVDAMVEEHRRRIEQERALDEEERRKEHALEQFKQQVIEQERQRLLREHATKLLGYLPKGVFKDEKDLELFDDEFKRKLQLMA